MHPLAVGIDLGTTNSVIARIDEYGRAEPIPNSEGERLTPSVIYFGDEPPLVGAAAKAMQGAGEEQIASFFKRSMGDPNYLLSLGGRDWTPVDLSALVLKKLRDDAAARLKTVVDRAVITVPAYFNNAQREATKEAGKQAGLEVLRIINEPTAAALAYRMDRTGREETLMVYDLGGGTFDISLVVGTKDELRVVATAGDHNLGGKDWDDRIAAFLGQSFAEAHGVDPLDDRAVSQEFLVLAETAKKALTQRESTRVKIDHHGSSLSVELARTVFDALTRDLMGRTETLCDIVLKDAGLSWNKLTGVLLVGGSTNMPVVKQYVTRMTGKPPMTGVDQDLAVALGAAVMAGSILGVTTGRGILIHRDVTAHSLGVIAASEDASRFTNSIVISRHTIVPGHGEKSYKAVVGKGGAVEVIVYVTEGESDDPRAVAVRDKHVCRGVSSQPCKHAIVRVCIGYRADGTIKVSASEEGSDRPFEVEKQPAGDLKWLSRSPRELDEFDPTTLKLAVTSRAYDDIGAILTSLGLSIQPYRTSADHSDYDIVFLNCCSSDPVDPSTLRQFVTRGGCVYASDFMDQKIEAAFPGLFDFGGHVGDAGRHPAKVEDPELQSALGRTIDVNFDTGAWAVINSASDHVRVLLRSKQSGKPLMVMAKVGDGTVFFTCFHNHKQASESETKLLQLLVLKQISAAAGVPIETVANSSKLVWRL